MVDFRNGFSDPNGNFWLGNEKIHQMTNPGLCTLRVIYTISSTNQVEFADYMGFKIDTEANGYQILAAPLSVISNTSFDAFFYRRNMKFSTDDRDNDAALSTDCATRYQAGFWYGGDVNTDSLNCGCMNLNGISLDFSWSGLQGLKCSNVALKNSQMWLIC